MKKSKKPMDRRPRIGVGEPIWRFNLGGPQMTTKAMLLAAGGLVAAYVPGGIKLGRLDLTREEITKTYMRARRDGPGLTHLLMIDQDMVFPRDLVARLAGHDLPLVAALYMYRSQGRPLPLMFNFDADGIHVVADWPAGQLVPCDATGAGAVLIANEVLDACGPPWWVLPEGSENGEDIAFFERAKAAGYQLYVDTACVCGHVEEQALSLVDYWRWREEHPGEIVYPG